MEDDGRWKAFSAHEIEVTAGIASKTSLTGISLFGSFHFEKDGIRARKYNDIGVGVVLKERSMIKHEYSYETLLEGGYLSKSPEFWKKFDNEEDKEVDNKQESGEVEDVTGKEGIFACSDRRCTAQFLTLEGWAKHDLRGVHRRRKNSESTIDAGVRLFAATVETDGAASLSVKSDSLASMKGFAGKLQPQGWAMKKTERAKGMTDEITAEVTAYFHKRRREGRRALAREIYADLKEMKTANDEYKYLLIDCPKETQCQSLISSLLRQESPAKSRQTKSRKKDKGADKANVSQESTDEQIPDDSNSTVIGTQARKRKQCSKPKKSLLKTEKRQLFEDDDEFAEMMEEIDDNIDEIFDE